MLSVLRTFVSGRTGMFKTGFYIVNAITVYRIVAAFFLVYLIVSGKQDFFKWMLAVSFFTDAVDGFLARRWNVVTVLGSRLDSVADDLTVLVAIIGMWVFEPQFVKSQLPLILFLTALYLLQLAIAFVRYGKPTSFHTYLAKAAAAMQGVFLVLLFFIDQPIDWLFYIAAAITFLDLVEEIILAFRLPLWKTDVKGLYWIQKANKTTASQQTNVQ